MISKKEFLAKVDRAKLKKIESIFRQIAEERPHLTEKSNERRFYDEARKILPEENFDFEHASFWLSGYRHRNKN